MMIKQDWGDGEKGRNTEVGSKVKGHHDPVTDGHRVEYDVFIRGVIIIQISTCYYNQNVRTG